MVIISLYIKLPKTINTKPKSYKSENFSEPSIKPYSHTKIVLVIFRIALLKYIIILTLLKYLTTALNDLVTYRPNMLKKAIENMPAITKIPSVVYENIKSQAI